MYYVYILSNRSRTTFYTGVTNNLQRRLYEHKIGLVKGFTKIYLLKYLMYYEEYINIEEAIIREKQIKNWHRQWKVNLIREKNNALDDLALNW